MYSLSLTAIELARVFSCIQLVTNELSDEKAEPLRDLRKVIESQTTPKAMGGET